MLKNKIKDKVNKIKKREFIKIVSESYTKIEVCKKLGWTDANKYYLYYYWIDKLIEKYKCDTSRLRKKYNVIEKICPVCGVTFETKDGERKRDKKCCSRQCAVTLKTGKQQGWREKFKCLICGKQCKKNSVKFCSVECRGRYVRLNTFEKIENGTYKYSTEGTAKNKLLKLYLIEKYGYKCMICGLSEWMSQQIPLQLDHIDGNSENNNVNNIRNLCPNCHAQTPTFCGKNIANEKRQKRKSKIKE